MSPGQGNSPHAAAHVSRRLYRPFNPGRAGVDQFGVLRQQFLDPGKIAVRNTYKLVNGLLWQNYLA